MSVLFHLCQLRSLAYAHTQTRTNTVNTASRMESTGFPMCIHTSDAVRLAAQAEAANPGYIADQSLLIPPFAEEVGVRVWPVFTLLGQLL